MRPNLSLEHIATALAALGTSVIVGCGGSEPAAQAPVQSVEVASPPAAAGPAAVSVGVAAPAAVVAAPAAPTTPALGVAATGTGTVAATVATPATPTVAVTVKPKAPPAKKGSNAQASCGAGTCSAAK